MKDQPPTPSLQLSELIDRQENISDSFVAEMDMAVKSLPENLTRALAKAGYRVVLSRTVPDAVPSARNMQVRGYVRTTTWSHVYGMFNRGTRRVVMAEYAESEPGSGPSRMITLDDSHRRLGILHHEFGHAVDQYMGNVSHTPAFLDAYRRGVARLSAQERNLMKYYLQDGHAGLEEAFAESLALICGNGCSKDTDGVFADRFPELLALVKRRIDSIGA